MKQASDAWIILDRFKGVQPVHRLGHILGKEDISGAHRFIYRGIDQRLFSTRRLAKHIAADFVLVPG